MKTEKLGLVLSGGGTKGVAHAGVLQFLKEKKIRPEIISGCSAGSIVGSLYAIGKTPKKLYNFLSRCIFSIGDILRLINRDWFLLKFLKLI